MKRPMRICEYPYERMYIPTYDGKTLGNRPSLE